MLARRTLLSIALSIPATLLAQRGDVPPVNKFGIAGKVKRPGVYDLRDGMRVADALIQRAGGFEDFADLTKISIVRGIERYYFNYRAFLRGERLEENIQLENNDTIVVP
jgi:protein involved in polysaccharide export with SLBB domain